MTALLAKALIWQAAAEYRIEPIEWLEGIRDRYSPIIDEWRRRRYERIAELQAEAGLKPLTPRDVTPTDQERRLRTAVFERVRDEFPKTDEIKTAESEATHSHNALVRYQRLKANQRITLSWQRVVLVSKGRRPEYSMLRVNLAEQLLLMSKQFKGNESYVQDTALLFCSAYGDLNAGPPRDDEEDWNTLEKWAEMLIGIEALSEFLQGKSDNPEFETSSDVQIVLQRGGGGRPKMSLLPTSLYGFIGYQFAELASGGSKLDNCQECGRFFFHGGSSSRKAGALYCDEVCREKSKTKRRAVARKAEAEPKKKIAPKRREAAKRR